LANKGKISSIAGTASTGVPHVDKFLRDIHGNLPFLEDFFQTDDSQQPLLKLSSEWIGSSIILQDAASTSPKAHAETYCQSVKFNLSKDEDISVSLANYRYTSWNKLIEQWIVPLKGEDQSITEVEPLDFFELCILSIRNFNANAQRYVPPDNINPELIALLSCSSSAQHQKKFDTPTEETVEPISTIPSEECSEAIASNTAALIPTVNLDYSFPPELPHSVDEESVSSGAPFPDSPLPQIISIDAVFSPESAAEIELPSSRSISADLPSSVDISAHIKQRVHEFLSHVHIADHVTLFQRISDAEYRRLYEIVDEAIADRLENPDSFQIARALAEQQATSYAFLQHPVSIHAFADYFEFYQVTLNNECQARLMQCRELMTRLADETFHTRDLRCLSEDQFISLWQKTSSELLKQTHDSEAAVLRAIFIDEVEKSKHPHTPNALHPKIQKDAELLFRLIAEKFGRKDSFGIRERIGFSFINPSLDKNEIVEMIQQKSRTHELSFETETTGVLHVSKFFNALPLHEQKAEKNHVRSFLRSAATTIESPTEKVIKELNDEGDSIFIFQRQLDKETNKTAEARVKISKTYGRTTLYSYSISPSQ
jgi:hypothetical protein